MNAAPSTPPAPAQGAEERLAALEGLVREMLRQGSTYDTFRPPHNLRFDVSSAYVEPIRRMLAGPKV